jgi:hypothetical protein
MLLDNMRNPAWGMYFDGAITFASNPLESTPRHEVLHGYIELVSTPEERAAAIREAMRMYHTKDKALAEELMADDFDKFARAEESPLLTVKLKQFFIRVWDRLLALVKLENPLRQLYRDIVNKKRPDGYVPGQSFGTRWSSNLELARLQKFEMMRNLQAKFFSLPQLKGRDVVPRQMVYDLLGSESTGLRPIERTVVRRH